MDVHFYEYSTLLSAFSNMSLFIGFFLCIPFPVAILASTPVVTQLTDRVELGEGPFWDEICQVLYFCDVDGKALHRLDPVTKKDQVLYFDQKLSIVLPVKGKKYQFVLALGRDITLLSWDYDKNLNRTTRILTVEAHSPESRWNDGLADFYGRIWAGTKGPENEVGESPPGRGTLYSIDGRHPTEVQAVPKLEAVTISNGADFTKDNTKFFYIDSPTRKVDVFEFDLNLGEIKNRKALFSFDDYNITGIPDGMCTDSDNNLWVASVGPGLVLKIDSSTGKLLQTIQFPTKDITSVAFGGKDLSTLLVTTKKPHVGRGDAQAGAVFTVTGLGVTGTLKHRVVLSGYLEQLSRQEMRKLYC